LLFLHCFLDLLAALGAQFRAFFATFVKDLLRTDEFDEGLLASVALPKSCPNDSNIAAIAITIAWSYLAEEAIDNLAGSKKRCGETSGSNITALAEGNHLLDVRTHGLGFRDRGLNTLFKNERTHQVAQQCATMARVTS